MAKVAVLCVCFSAGSSGHADEYKIFRESPMGKTKERAERLLSELDTRTQNKEVITAKYLEFQLGQADAVLTTPDGKVIFSYDLENGASLRILLQKDQFQTGFTIVPLRSVL